jgi:hypothetical protein
MESSCTRLLRRLKTCNTLSLLRVGLLILLFLFASPAQAADQIITLQEHLGRDWKNQLLSYPFHAPQGACAPNSIQLACPKGPIAAQLSDITYWPDNKTVKTATLWFITDLAPLATYTYTLSYSTTPAPALKTDLNSTTDNAAGITLKTSAIQLTLPASSDASAPAPFKSLTASGLTATSRFYGAAKPLSVSHKLTDTGPVFARAITTCTFENNTTLKITFTLPAGSSTLFIDETVTSGDLPDSGWDILFPTLLASGGAGATGFNKGKLPLSNIPPGKSGTLDLSKEPPGTLLSLQPWQDWWAQKSMVTWNIGTLQNPNLLTIASANPGVWVPAGPPGSFGSNANYERKLIHLQKSDKSDLYLRCNLASGSRSWLLGAVSESAPQVGTRLNTIKDYTLDWAGPLGSHPRLFLTQADLDARARQNKPINTAALNQQIATAKLFRGEPHGTSDTAAVTAYIMSGMDKSVAQQVRLVDRLENHLSIIAQADKPPMAHQLGSPGKAVDLFRDCNVITLLYDAALAGDLLTEAQKRLARARLAYLAYLLNDPIVWSTSRGYKTGNVNMSVGYAMNAGLIACALPDHPDALKWIGATPANNQLTMPYLETFLNKLGPDGEFPESVSNYLHVTVTPMFAFAVALRNANLKDASGTPFHDYVADERMIKLVRYATAQFTPPDPRRNNTSVRPASGRGNALHSEGLPGLVAKATVTSHPALSQEMQWYWLRTGPSYELTHHPLGGLEDFYLDPTLPAKAPSKTSLLFRDVGAIFKHGLGTKHEYYLNLLMIAGQHYVDWYPSESGGFPAIYARGVPISVRFAEGYAGREELLISRVLPAKGSDDAARKTFYHVSKEPGTDRHGQILAFSALPRQDYACVTSTMAAAVGPPAGLKTFKLPAWPDPIGKPALPITWTRQVLFIKDPDPAGANYFLLRDTIAQNQPTMWQFWTLSQRIGATKDTTPDKLKSFLQDAPGNLPAPARELFGDTFTAIGQFNVDTDFFIASPQDTPRHTLRWGTTYAHFANMAEFQDLLHIQMPGKGAYYVVIFPRDRAATPAKFQRLADGAILKVSGDFGTDYLYASETRQSATDKENSITFNTTAGSIQERAGQTSLSLAAPGSIQYKDITLESAGPVTLLITAGSIQLMTPQDQPNQKVTLTLPKLPKQTITTLQSTVTIPR